MIILDTSVISELMRPVCSPRVLRWVSRQHTDELYSSTITLAEILYGIELLPSGKRRTELLAGAERMFAQVLGNRIFAFEEHAARALARIASARRRRARPLAEFDAQIAAIAEVHGAALATRNIHDFDGCDVRVVNPWVD
jgi:predicted nucleic acid-binding protein